MINIFNFTSYREYLEEWISSQPNNGHGVKGQLARVLHVSSTLISFVLQGKKLLTMEQASDIADFIELSEAETDYLFLLVESERAGSSRLKQKLERKIKLSQEQSRKVAKRIRKDLELSNEASAIYYSSWIYTGIRNLVATGRYRDAASIAKRLSLPHASASKALQFLLENQLCIEQNGIIIAGPTYTHIEADSPYVNRHRQNWRLRGMTALEHKRESDLFYSSPMSLSRDDYEKIREMLISQIQDILAVMRPSPSETACCLNIDWFEY